MTNLEIDEQKYPVIRCPHCGHEYIPCEIFMPGEIIGKTTTVIRDALGKIIYQEYEDDNSPDQTEHFICENCEKPFVIEVSTTYKTKKQAEELDFSDLSASLVD